MPIAIAFTVTAALAVLLHGFYLGRIWGDYRALVNSKENGAVRQSSRAYLMVESARYAMNLFMLAAGAGLLLGGFYHNAAYLLALIPVVSTIATIIALKGFE